MITRTLVKDTPALSTRHESGEWMLDGRGRFHPSLSYFCLLLLCFVVFAHLMRLSLYLFYIKGRWRPSALLAGAM